MVRFVFIAILCVVLNANDSNNVLQEKIENILGESAYNRNINFINRLFSNQASFYKNGALDIYQVILTLQNNGLLQLKFKNPQEFSMVFVAETSPIFLLRTINKSLANMGYSYWTTNEASYQENIARLTISLTTEHIVDPIALLNELQKNGFVSVSILREADNKWEYELLVRDSKLPDSRFISKGNSISITEVVGEYWLELGSSDGRLYISTRNNRSFNPVIIFFDKDLNILEVQNLSKRSNVNISVVNNTKFIKIKDSISSSNINSGINVRFK